MGMRRGSVGRVGTSRRGAVSEAFSFAESCAKVPVERRLANNDREGDRSASPLESLAMDTESPLSSL